MINLLGLQTSLRMPLREPRTALRSPESTKMVSTHLKRFKGRLEGNFEPLGKCREKLGNLTQIEVCVFCAVLNELEKEKSHRDLNDLPIR